MGEHIQTAALILLGLLALSAVYVGIAFALAGRFRLRDEGLETLVIELPRPGHHIALVHHVPVERRYAEPVILCHGLGANRFNFDFLDDGAGSTRMSFGRMLAAAGFDVWLLEIRGHGRARVPKGADWNADDQVAEDLPVAIETVLDLTGAERVYWVGHSWGGILQYIFHARGNPLTEKLAGLVTVGSPGTLQFQPELKQLLAPGAVVVEKLGRGVPLRFLGVLGVPLVWFLQWIPRFLFPDISPMSNGLVRRLFASLAEDIPHGVALQALQWIRTGRFAPMGSPRFDDDRYDKLTLPMLLVAGSCDTLAPPRSVEYVAERARSSDLTLRVMGREAGCSVEFGHGGLLVGEHAPDEVYPVVRTWLEKRATPSVRVQPPRAHKKNGAVRGGPLL